MVVPWQVEQSALFYEFSLDTHVPADHLMRSIDRFVDLSDLRRALAPFYASTGRPSVDPELMIRMLLIGYCLGIRSERRLCQEVHLNLACRWFCRLGLDGRVPDHSTFSKNRHGRFRDSDLLREVFEATVQRCIDEGLVGGKGFAVDASLIRADANKQRVADALETVEWDDLARTRRSVREYLDTLDEAAWGAASETTPKFVSRSDPAAQWTGAMKGHAFFAYATNYLIDLDHAVIVDVEATRAAPRARSMERPATKGPRSLMRTTTERPVAVLVTRTRVPKRRVRWAAVRAFWSKRSPLAVSRPWKPGPYHEAISAWAGVTLSTRQARAARAARRCRSMVDPTVRGAPVRANAGQRMWV